MTFLSQVTTGTKNTIGANNVMSGQSTPRASYAIASSNASSTFHGAVFLDAEFRRIGAPGNTAASNQGAGFTNDMDQYNTTYINNSGQMFHNSLSPNTQTSMSTGSHSSPLPGTASMGEYGQATFSAHERGVIVSSALRALTNTISTPHRANRAFVNSDHKNKQLTLQFSAGYLTTSPTVTPVPYGATTVAPFVRPEKNVAPSFAAFDAGSQTVTMYGSASYNAVRKELLVATFTTTTVGRVNVAIWKGFDFDAVRGDVSTLGEPDVLLQTTLASFVNVNEARFNSKWVLVDDGRIYVSSFNENSNTTHLWELTRSVDDTTLSNVLLSTQSMTTSYGYDQGSDFFGQRQMQTRNGNMVCNWMVYYYYQCGIRSWLIDKRNSSWSQGYSENNTTSGTYPVKYRDDSFAFPVNGNYYAGNFTGARMGAFARPAQTAGGAPAVFPTTLYFPIAPGPNTTNYPGLVHVQEFDFQTTLPY